MIWPRRKSEGFIVAWKSGNSGGAKGPCRRIVAQEEACSVLASAHNGFKHDSAVATGWCSKRRWSPCMSINEYLRASRMREIRTSGLTRGEAAALAAPLLLDHPAIFKKIYLRSCASQAAIRNAHIGTKVYDAHESQTIGAVRLDSAEFFGGGVEGEEG